MNSDATTTTVEVTVVTGAGGKALACAHWSAHWRRRLLSGSVNCPCSRTRP